MTTTARHRPLLIGQAPGPNTDPDLPLFPIPRTSAGGRLQQMTGLTRGQYLQTFERINLLTYFPGLDKKEDKFPRTPARFAAEVIKPLLAGRDVIMVGRGVAEAFGYDAAFLEWNLLQVRRRHAVRVSGAYSARVAVVPHTSGRNRWYNTEGNRLLAEEFWRDYIKNHLKVELRVVI